METIQSGLLLRLNYSFLFSNLLWYSSSFDPCLIFKMLVRFYWRKWSLIWAGGETYLCMASCSCDVFLWLALSYVCSILSAAILLRERSRCAVPGSFSFWDSSWAGLASISKIFLVEDISLLASLALASAFSLALEVTFLSFLVALDLPDLTLALSTSAIVEDLLSLVSYRPGQYP